MQQKAVATVSAEVEDRIVKYRDDVVIQLRYVDKEDENNDRMTVNVR